MSKKQLAPNAYFKTEKGKQLDENKMSTASLFLTKKYTISTLPKRSYIDEIFRENKKHQVGPTTYKNLDSKDHRVCKENRTGAFVKGLIKSNTQQGQFIDAARAEAQSRPQPGKYTPVYVSLHLLIL